MTLNGNAIKKRRDELGLTQEQLKERTNVEVRTIQRAGEHALPGGPHVRYGWQAGGAERAGGSRRGSSCMADGALRGNAVLMGG